MLKTGPDTAIDLVWFYRPTVSYTNKYCSSTYGKMTVRLCTCHCHLPCRCASPVLYQYCTTCTWPVPVPTLISFSVQERANSFKIPLTLTRLCFTTISLFSVQFCNEMLDGAISYAKQAGVNVNLSTVRVRHSHG